jgi:ABC-type nitrate/sulfonate/bicarbonate transport system permease component
MSVGEAPTVVEAPANAGAESQRSRAARARRRRRGRDIPPLRGLLPLVVLLVGWQLIQHGQSAYFPRPSLWWDKVDAQWTSGALGPAIRTTLEAFVWSLIIATFLGTVLGIAVGRSRALDRSLGPTLDFCRFMPAAAVVPVVVLFAGYTEKMTIFVVVFAAIWPILLQVRDAMRAQSVLLSDVARSLQLGRLRTVCSITLPSLVPAIVLGLRVAAPMVLIVVLLVEIVTQTGGLGRIISQAQQNFDAATAYGILAIAGLFGVAINAIVSIAEGRLLRYRPDGD